MRTDILFYAFRYALGSMTYAVSTVVDELVRNWDEFEVHTQDLIKQEIIDAISDGKAGMEMDINEWRRVLDL